MIRHEGTAYREHMRDGRGTVTVHDILTKEELDECALQLQEIVSMLRSGSLLYEDYLKQNA